LAATTAFMEKITISTLVEVFENSQELPQTEQELLQTANEALEHAYAPYSRFRVGAAILLANGLVLKGNNQENAAYPSGLCAERVAFFAAGANYPGVAILKVAITAASMDFASDHPVAPCGACRQSMLEYEMNQSEPITVLMRGLSGKTFRTVGIRQLLPLFFHEEGLKSK